MIALGIVLICISLAWMFLCSWANHMCCAPTLENFLNLARWAFGMLVAGVICLCFSGCFSISQDTLDRIDEVLTYIPTQSPTPTMTPTPTPTPVPTPVPSLADSFKDIESFASANGLTIIQTGRGKMLDCRGYDVDIILSDWCSKSGGAAMPAFTDAETNGVFLQCR